MKLMWPELRLRIEITLAEGSPLYVLALDGLSVVAGLREFAWHFAVTLAECYLVESEYAVELVSVLSPIALTARLLPPGVRWESHATLRLRTQIRLNEGGETQEILLSEFVINEPAHLFVKRLKEAPNDVPASTINACNEEMAILLALDGFRGDPFELMERLQPYWQFGATLARSQLFHATARRAQTGLEGLYSEKPNVVEKIDQFMTWLIQVQDAEEADEERLAAQTAASITSTRAH